MSGRQERLKNLNEMTMMIIRNGGIANIQDLINKAQINLGIREEKAVEYIKLLVANNSLKLEGFGLVTLTNRIDKELAKKYLENKKEQKHNDPEADKLLENIL